MKSALPFLLLLTIASCQVTQLSTVSSFTSQLSVSNGSLSISSTAISCGQNKVTSKSGICIQPSYIQGCAQYATQNQCSSCNSGYIFSADRCDIDQTYTGSKTEVIGCLTYNLQAGCINCANGFFLSDQNCIKGIKNCDLYDNLQKCIKCEVEYTLVLSQCRHNSLLGCKYQTQSHTCQQCFAPFELSEQHCDIPNCQMLNDYGCVACQCGFYITQNRDCKPVANGCLRYQRMTCTDCLPHFKLKGGICQIQGCLQYLGQSCKTCKANYDNANGECRFQNCYQWLNDSCLVCNEGYVVQDTICVKIPSLSCA